MKRSNTICNSIRAGAYYSGFYGRMREERRIEANINPDTPIEEVNSR